ncbi:hypothetical protein JI749_13365 [Devosia oryziradicis]|uniref:Uncharacterized protein n=1 Tax=Devosia oryziradicis TaxID=2801335 RepID=A0ABX7BUW1_9HYPH|nr:hypothetical protein [Devosia oryziradicis]QQR35338.1 hypothetical protein JI749_13365 [Devosia oryziradicis]
MPKVLLSARDAAAAHHIAEMVSLAAQPGWQVVVVAQAPALLILQALGVDCIPVLLPPVTVGSDAEAMLHLAKGLLDAEKPDIIVAGLSSPGDGGIDEALLAVRKVPALLMQDFWGEQNRFFGSGADAFLALDEYARTVNQAKHGKSSFVVGSPRHARLARLDLAAERRKIRSKLNISENQSVYGWFGQSLHHIPGYRKSLAAWIEAIADTGCQLVYKPHPRESAAGQQATESLFAAAGVTQRTLSDWTIESALLACDVATSILSNCLYDAAYLNYFSATPLIAPVAWLTEQEVRAVFDAVTSVHDLPYQSAGIAHLVQERADMNRVRSAALPETRRQLWQAARANLTDPREAGDRVAAAILATLN